jgi:putative ABC transport system permease protein
MKRTLIELRESIRMALEALATHKLRSALTLLGVLVGVFSIILVMTAMRAMKNKIEGELGQLGGQTFIIQRMPMPFFGRGEDFMRILRRQPISLTQAQALQKKATLAAQIGLRSSLVGGIELTSPYAKTPPNVQLEGATPEIFPAANWNIIEGRALLESDVAAARDVCVISESVALALFRRGSAVGERIKYSALTFTVVGVLLPVSSNEQERGIAVIPITTGLNRFGRRRDISVMVQAPTPAAFSETMEQCRGALRAIRKVPPGKEEDFEMISSDSMIAQFQQVTFAVRTGLALVSSIALIAAGIGIMNIMLVSVTERTREIGIRRAIGAKKRNIMVQFIVEAVVLCEIGGLAGVLLGLAGANALAIYLLKVPPAFPADWAVIGLGICSLVGVVFGSYPAYKAANLDPIESLRYE